MFLDHFRTKNTGGREMATFSKTKKASKKKNQEVLDLLDLASSATASTFKSKKSSAKLFELVVLAEMLALFKSKHHSNKVVVCNQTPNVLYLAGAPSRADKKKFSYFELHGSGPLQEAWVSVQFSTLSWDLYRGVGVPFGAERHEIDVGIFNAIPEGLNYPPYQMLLAGVSCKHFSVNKECVREALGIRRETALLSKTPSRGAASWIWPGAVPASPPSPLFLASSNAGVYQYAQPIDKFGLYVSFVPF